MCLRSRQIVFFFLSFYSIPRCCLFRASNTIYYRYVDFGNRDTNLRTRRLRAIANAESRAETATLYRITPNGLSNVVVLLQPRSDILVRALSRRAIEPGVHGTSSCTRTSGGRLNLGLARPRVRYSTAYSTGYTHTVRQTNPNVLTLSFHSHYNLSLSPSPYSSPLPPPSSTARHVRMRERKAKERKSRGQ